MARSDRPRRLVALPVLALLSALLAAGCGEPSQEKMLTGHFGPGSGGPPLSGTTATITFTKANGEVTGYGDYDPIEFTALGPQGDSEMENLAEATGTLGIAMVRIAGRPDTPCRFQAALLARDEGYDIVSSGTRKNSQALDFSLVNLKRGGTRISLFCAELRGDVGVLIQVLTDDPAKIDWEQVHYVLNTVRKSG